MFIAETCSVNVKVGPKKRVLPQPVGVNARGSSDTIFQIAVISENVSKFG